MMTILIYGFAYVYLMTRIFGYHLSAIQTLLPVALAFVLIQTAFKSKKTTMISLLAFTIATAGSGFVLYITGRLNEVLAYLWTLIEPYYESLASGVTVDLTHVQEGLIVVIIALVFSKLIITYRTEKYSYYVISLIGIITVVVGFLTSRLSAQTDRMAIVIFAMAQILYFFYHYYQYKIMDHESKDDYKFAPFITVVTYYCIVGVMVAFMMFTSKPFPFYREVVAPKTYETLSPEERLQEVFEYMVDQTGSIRDSFLFSGVTMMEVGGDKDIRYLKGLVYESFDGEWHQETSELFKDTADLDAYGVYRDVEVVHTRIRTPIIFAAGYQIRDIDVTDGVQVIKEDDSDTYIIDNYDLVISSESITYSYQGLDLDRHSDQFRQLLNNADGDFDLDGTVYALPDGYAYIRDFTESIVSDEMTNFEKTEAIINYLKQNYLYNVEPPKPVNDNADRIAYFLSGSKEGFCQHFSTAAALMLRAENIPTRYVTGYLVDYDVDYADIQYDQSLMEAVSHGRVTVKDSNAHTWLEVYFQGVGWIPFEATGLVSDDVVVNTVVDITDVESVNETARMDDSTKRILIIVSISIGGIVILYGCYLGIRRIVRRKLLYRKGTATNQVIILNQMIHDYMKAVKVERGQDETYREYAKRMDGYHISDHKYYDMIRHYEAVVYGHYTVDEDIRDGYIEILEDVRKFVRKQANIFHIIQLTVKEWVTL